MEIKFYNSLTNKIEPFKTLKENQVSMYVCGPTVYNHPHIGNMRPVVVFDTLRRFLTYVGYKVTYVSNFTDVDDKIIKAAKEKNISEKELTDFFISEFKKVTLAINSELPSITPRVTDYIPKIIAYIEKLISLGAAYKTNNGDVYFRVSKIKDYGSLSGINLDDLKVGARIEENKDKESPLDFALWKKSEEGISWDSPFSKGRPGWHTECCVMIDSIFNSDYIDIHGGGYDLKFPHHENEIAQGEIVHQTKIAKYWIHNAFINFGKEKMSKSLGNIILAKDLIKLYGGNVVRLVILSAHYRQGVNFTEETINSAIQEINKMSLAYTQLSSKLQLNNVDLSLGKPIGIEPFLIALGNDLNTANALYEIYNIIKLANLELRKKESDFSKLNDYFKTLTDMFYCLGLNITYRKFSTEDKALYQKYLSLKEEKRFSESDEIRKKLIALKIL